MNGKNFRFDNLQNPGVGKAVFEKKLNGLSVLRFGGEYWNVNYRPKYNDTLYKLLDHYSAAFAEASIYLSKPCGPGGYPVRTFFDHQKSALAPASILAYKTSKNAQVSMAYGLLPETRNPAVYAGTQVGYTGQPIIFLTTSAFTISVRSGWKPITKYDDLIKQVPVAYNFYYYNNTGSGYAKGN